MCAVRPQPNPRPHSPPWRSLCSLLERFDSEAEAPLSSLIGSSRLVLLGLFGATRTAGHLRLAGSRLLALRLLSFVLLVLRTHSANTASVAQHARPLRGRSVPDLDRNTEEAMSEGMAERESPGEAGLGRTMYLKTSWTKRSRLFGSKETPLRGRHSDYL